MKKLEERAGEFGEKLMGWFVEHARELPWRQKPSLYKTVVSEFMLQQTQVETVLPYFLRWQEVFPGFEALAAADEEEVVKHWEGLGYYSRARNLHKLAKAYVAEEEKPVTREGWLKFPGVGPYSSAAITSIGLGLEHAVVDGNVIRVLARLTNDDREFKDNSSAMKAFEGLAQAMLNRSAPGKHNEAMMELGAKVCVKSNPMCLMCPVEEFCEGKTAGDPGRLPKLVRRKVVKRRVNRVFCERDGALLLHQRSGDSKRLANMYELPEVMEVGDWEEICVKKRGISNERIDEYIYRVGDYEGEGCRWVGLDELEKVTLSGPHKKWVKEILGASE